jgi:DNA-binding response OmpR family regulator
MVESSLNDKSKILVVEDEVEINELIAMLLTRQGHQVQQCGSAVEAFQLIRSSQYDLIVLDWMLPHLSGIDFLKSIQNQPEKPTVLKVTAKAEPQDIVVGLESGADDYITKPFEPSVFSARVKALLRRIHRPVKDQIAMGNLVVDLNTFEVKCGSEKLKLTPSEFKILAELGKSSGKVMTRDYLVSVVQGDGISVTNRTIDTHVFGLRKKLGACADVIETIRGVGYRVKTDL